VEPEPALDIKNNGIVRRSSHESDVSNATFLFKILIKDIPALPTSQVYRKIQNAC